jgi:hypothetical protein
MVGVAIISKVSGREGLRADGEAQVVVSSTVVPNSVDRFPYLGFATPSPFEVGLVLQRRAGEIPGPAVVDREKSGISGPIHSNESGFIGERVSLLPTDGVYGMLIVLVYTDIHKDASHLGGSVRVHPVLGNRIDSGSADANVGIAVGVEEQSRGNKDQRGRAHNVVLAIVLDEEAITPNHVIVTWIVRTRNGGITRLDKGELTVDAYNGIPILISEFTRVGVLLASEIRERGLVLLGYLNPA